MHDLAQPRTFRQMAEAEQEEEKVVEPVEAPGGGSNKKKGVVNWFNVSKGFGTTNSSTMQFHSLAICSHICDY